jgi:hypothetical protein
MNSIFIAKMYDPLSVQLCYLQVHIQQIWVSTMIISFQSIHILPWRSIYVIWRMVVAGLPQQHCCHYSSQFVIGQTNPYHYCNTTLSCALDWKSPDKWIITQSYGIDHCNLLQIHLALLCMLAHDVLTALAFLAFNRQTRDGLPWSGHVR